MQGVINIDFGNLVNEDELRTKIISKSGEAARLEFEYKTGPPRPANYDPRGTLSSRRGAANLLARKKTIYIVGDVANTNFPDRYGRSMHSFEEVDLSVDPDYLRDYANALARYRTEVERYEAHRSRTSVESYREHSVRAIP